MDFHRLFDIISAIWDHRKRRRGEKFPAINDVMTQRCKTLEIYGE